MKHYRVVVGWGGEVRERSGWQATIVLGFGLACHRQRVLPGAGLGGAVASVSDATETRQTAPVCRVGRGGG